ncbi:MAG TPA: hypothetical protein VFC17_06500 [Candidatus Limnocylindrales bacterium]|nr:hypothetical protein [Candidatus Limnocylindrales bacterium]
MNPNDLLAQQQAFYEQAMQRVQQNELIVAIFSLCGFLITALVIYMFYARLRDIAEELMKLRVAYEFANSLKSGGTDKQHRPPSP